MAREPAAEWTLPALAAKVHMSTEHLRRLCLRELGRTPVQQLTYLRMQRAKELLENSDDKLEAIAPAVGYLSALVFSRAFKRWIGCTPTEDPWSEVGGGKSMHRNARVAQRGVSFTISESKPTSRW